VTETNLNDRDSVEVGRFAREHLPANAVLFCEEPLGHEHLTTMVYADRTCYPLQPRKLDALARAVIEAGGIPYVVSRRELPYPVVHARTRHGPAIYRWE
jgi:hypothetical protein